MIYGPLGMKCLEWDTGQRVFKSPRWGTDWTSPIKWAECSVCPKDEEGHIIIQENHSCGIYVTIRKAEAISYMDNHRAVCLLMEGLGRNTGWMHEFGFTASGVEVVGLIDITRFRHSQIKDTGKGYEFRITHQQYVMEKALEVFALSESQIFPYDFAIEMMKIQWAIHSDDPWPFDY